jgi:hypothetical protein
VIGLAASRDDVESVASVDLVVSLADAFHVEDLADLQVEKFGLSAAHCSSTVDSWPQVKSLNLAAADTGRILKKEKRQFKLRTVSQQW